MPTYQRRVGLAVVVAVGWNVGPMESKGFTLNYSSHSGPQDQVFPLSLGM